MLVRWSPLDEWGDIREPLMTLIVSRITLTTFLIETSELAGKSLSEKRLRVDGVWLVFDGTETVCGTSGVRHTEII